MQIVTLHSNSHMCGVSKFNRILGQKLALEVVALDKNPKQLAQELLVSISFPEFDKLHQTQLEALLSGKHFGLVVHGLAESDFQTRLLGQASWIMALNEEILEQIQGMGLVNVILGWSPPTVSIGGQLRSSLLDMEPDDKQLFMFGMSKKFNSESLNHLERVLGKDVQSWRLVISAGLHENSRFDDEFFAKVNGLRARSKLQVFFAGFLSDEAVSEYLLASRACVLIFSPAARANNSTLTSALDHGCNVLTNVDKFTPHWMLNTGAVSDLESIAAVPPRRLTGSLLPESMGWDSLAKVIQTCTRAF